MKTLSKALVSGILLLASCQKQELQKNAVSPSTQPATLSKDMISENGVNPDETILSAGSEPDKSSLSNGHVYLESNGNGTNSVIKYDENGDGSLTWSSNTKAGGNGGGIALGSEGAVILNESKNLLFAVNAGSNSISSFKIGNNGGLTLAATVNSGGQFPVSLCEHNGILYVVNSTSADISGFSVGWDGSMTAIVNSHQNLSGADALPAQISFSPSGRSVLITEKMTNKISAFPVDTLGVAGPRVTTSSAGTEPFGFDFSRGQFMIVSNAENGAAGASSCTSYKNLFLDVTNVNGSVVNHQSASCWVSVSKYGRFAYVVNAASNNIVTYYVDPSGNLYFIPWTVTNAGKDPADIRVSDNNLFVYNINGKDRTIGEYKRGFLGTLNNIGYIPGLPAFAAGIATY
jgi:6-phosphogluconolactonase